MLCRWEVAGHSRTKVVPSPSTDSTDTMPPIASMLSRTMDRPSPIPCAPSSSSRCACTRTNCSKIAPASTPGCRCRCRESGRADAVARPSASTRTTRAGLSGIAVLDGVGEQVHDHELHAARVGGERWQAGVSMSKATPRATAMSLSWPATSWTTADRSTCCSFGRFSARRVRRASRSSVAATSPAGRRCVRVSPTMRARLRRPCRGPSAPCQHLQHAERLRGFRG